MACMTVEGPRSAGQRPAWPKPLRLVASSSGLREGCPRRSPGPESARGRTGGPPRPARIGRPARGSADSAPFSTREGLGCPGSPDPRARAARKPRFHRCPGVEPSGGAPIRGTKRPFRGVPRSDAVMAGPPARGTRNDGRSPAAPPSRQPAYLVGGRTGAGAAMTRQDAASTPASLHCGGREAPPARREREGGVQRLHLPAGAESREASRSAQAPR